MAAVSHSQAGLEDKMLGYWKPNAKAMEEVLKEEAADDPQAEAMLAMMLQMMTKIGVEIEKGKVTFHVMGQTNTSTYKIIKEDAATKTLTMEVTEEESDTSEEGTATIDGDKLTLKKKEGDEKGDTIVLDRITKEEFEKLKNAAPPGGGIIPQE